MSLNIRFTPKGIDIEHVPGKTILESAIAAGIRLPHSCDAGTCQICEGRLLSGDVIITSNIHQDNLQGSATDRPALLCCKAIPTTNCTVEIENVLSKGELPLVTVACQTLKITPLNHDVTQYLFKYPAGKKLDFYAGQYLEILLEQSDQEQSVFPFSIANEPNSDRLLELHIRDVPSSAPLAALKAYLKEGEVVNIRLPQGDCTLTHIFSEKLTTDNSPLVFLAGSTGFAPVKAMIEYCISEKVQRPIYVYWGGRTRDDLYMHELAESWNSHENITYIPVISEPENDEEWNGRTGFVHKALMEDFLPFAEDLTIIAGGSPGMVHAACDDFIEAGLSKEQLHSDVFAYAPK